MPWIMAAGALNAAREFYDWTRSSWWSKCRCSDRLGEGSGESQRVGAVFAHDDARDGDEPVTVASRREPARRPGREDPSAERLRARIERERSQS
jgi:hypothetical protein